MPRDSAVVPCAVFAFNRPDKLERVLAALRGQDVDRLIVFVDGPRDDADVELVEGSRAIAKAVDWVDRELHFGDQNRGLPGLSDNVSTIMSAYESAIFVEDDCLPMPGFYSFMRRALSHYEPEKKVFSIGGYQPIPHKYFKEYPYSLVSCARFTCWGWATWQDRWELIAPYLSRYWELFDGLMNVPDVAGHDLATMARACAEGRLETWDVQVAISTLWLEQVHLLPTRGLVRNIGIAGGTHRASRRSRHRRERAHDNNIYEHSLENIVWLESVELNSDYGERLGQFVATAGLPLVSRVKGRLRQVHFVLALWRSLRRSFAWSRKALKLVILLPRHIICRMRGSRYSRWEYEFSELLGGSPILLNANQVRKTAGLKRALLAYIVSPFFLDPRSPEFVVHQNRWLAVEMARLLGELGYIVDVINWNDYHSKLAHDYDLLLGFGRQAEDLAKELPERTIKIRLATGSEAGFANERERERTEAVNRVRDCGVKVVRQSPDRSEYLRFFDAIACIGNRVTAATYRPFFKGAIHTWNNCTYDQWIGLPEGKDFSKSRRNFLYFAGGGQILIGLDLVLEVFVSRPQVRLFVCGPFEGERDFVECFRRELYETPNIVPVGWVPVGSQRYLELTRMCGIIIFPICAGASPGSVIVCMGQGLIPIVSREAGMDTDDFGVTLPSINTEEIGKAVDWISSQTASWHEHTSRKVLRAARQDFSQAAFGKRFREILTAVTRDKTLDSVGE